jgi:hypothetical protein
MQLPFPVMQSLSILSSFFLIYEHEYQIKITEFLMQFTCIISIHVVFFLCTSPTLYQPTSSCLIRYALPHLSLSSTVQMAAAAADTNDLVAKK